MPKQEERGDVSPVRTRLLKQPAIQNGVAKACHLASSNRLFSARPQQQRWRSPARLESESSDGQRQNARTPEAAQAWSALAAQAKTASEEASTKPRNENRGLPCKRTSCLPEPYSSLRRRRRTFPKILLLPRDPSRRSLPLAGPRQRLPATSDSIACNLSIGLCPCSFTNGNRAVAETISPLCVGRAKDKLVAETSPENAPVACRK